MILYKVSMFASDSRWSVSVTKFEAKETEKSYIINDYSAHRLSKDKVGKIDTITNDSNSFISRRIFITDESKIKEAINLLALEIKSILNKMKLELEKTISGSPTGEIDSSKIIVEDRTQEFNFTLTEDML